MLADTAQRNSHTSPRAIALCRLQAEALSLREQGRNYQQIPNHMKRPMADNADKSLTVDSEAVTSDAPATPQASTPEPTESMPAKRHAVVRVKAPGKVVRKGRKRRRGKRGPYGPRGPNASHAYNPKSAKNLRPGPKFKPTKEQRAFVLSMAGFKMSLDEIAAIVHNPRPKQAMRFRMLQHSEVSARSDMRRFR